MTSIFYSEPELVISLHKKIICLNPNDLQIFKEIEIPEDLTQCGLDCKGKENNEDGDQETTKAMNKEKPNVQNVAISPDHMLMAVTTYGQKALLLYQLRLEHAKLLSVRSLARNSSALAFTADSKYVMVTDKAGDCYQYNCIDYKSSPKLLLGHLSIVYDIKLASGDKYIITCDRDEKIRVTNYPETHEIHIYCLGHREFVSAVELLNEDTLISISGDKTLRIWNFIEGKELINYNLPAPGLRLAANKLNKDNYQAAVCFYGMKESVGIFDIKKSLDNSWTVELKEILDFDDMEVFKTCFADKRLYVVGSVNDKFKIKTANLEGFKKAPNNWLEMVEEQFEESRWALEDVSSWFKKKYDNVSLYLEKKKRRIEEKQNKQK